eukprot:gb/GECG01007063.1/.p1 GENE.gb/GECG01007063.1/~~gb/GECG01007063.1/.p1  ORF type:complete len:313 (+),score=40.45 gb/GECG01007063.1/:1-939(+)
MASSTYSMTSTVPLSNQPSLSTTSAGDNASPAAGSVTNIPVFGLGTYLAAGDDCYNAVLKALQYGYRHIDTAAVYKNEEEVAKAIKDSGVPREDIFITTKLSPREQGEEAAYAACEKSLQRLSTSYVDLYLIHWPGAANRDPDDPQTPEIRMGSWRALQKLLKEGKAKSIGVSNFLTWHLDHLLNHPDLTVKPSVNQIEFHPLLQQRETVDKCKENGIRIEAYAPLARAHKNLVNNDKMKELAKKYSKTVAQISLRWCLQEGCIIIPKSVKAERIEENANIFDFELTSQEVDAVKALEDGTRTCWDPNSVTH